MSNSSNDQKEGYIPFHRSSPAEGARMRRDDNSAAGPKFQVQLPVNIVRCLFRI